jgi:hypothetical protein
MSKYHAEGKWRLAVNDVAPAIGSGRCAGFLIFLRIGSARKWISEETQRLSGPIIVTTGDAP